MNLGTFALLISPGRDLRAFAQQRTQSPEFGKMASILPFPIPAIITAQTAEPA